MNTSHYLCMNTSKTRLLVIWILNLYPATLCSTSPQYVIYHSKIEIHSFELSDHSDDQRISHKSSSRVVLSIVQRIPMENAWLNPMQDLVQDLVQMTGCRLVELPLKFFDAKHARAISWRCQHTGRQRIACAEQPPRPPRLSFGLDAVRPRAIRPRDTFRDER
jgi:hypothetical protein